MDGPAPTLAGWLRDRTDDELAVLLAERPDLAVPVPADMSMLAARATVRVSSARALERLTRFELDVAEALTLLPDAAPAAAAAALLPPPARPALAAALDRLRDLALLWGDDDGLRPVGAVRELLGEHPLALGRPVAGCLARHGLRQLAPVLAALGLPAAGSPEAARRAVADLFDDAPALAVLLDGLDPAERAVIDRLGGPDGPFGSTPGALRSVRLPDATSPIERLLARGLLVGVEAERVELPREVGLALRAPFAASWLQPGPPALTGRRVGQRDADEAGALAAADVVRRVETLLEAWGTQPPGALRTGGLGVRDLRAAARLLDVTEPVAALLVEAATAAGLVDSEAALDPDIVPTTAFDRWLDEPVELRWALLAEGWLATSRVPGLVGARDEAGRGRALAAMSVEVERAAAPETRRRVLTALAGLPAGTVPEPAAVDALLDWTGPRRGGRLRSPLVAWTLSEAAELGVTGRGALTTAGRALVGGGAGTSTQAAARAVAPRLPAQVSELLVQADLTAVAPGPLVPDVAREVALVADVESTGAATVYRFSESSVRRALDAGRTAEELHALLGRLARAGVPQALGYLVDDVARRHGALRAGSAASYLRCDDTALLAQATADRRTATLGLRRLAPTVVVSPAPVPRLLEVLRAAGYSPVAEAPDGQVVLARNDVHRIPPRSRPASVRPELAGPRPDQLPDLVRSLRRGDEASASSRRALAAAVNAAGSSGRGSATTLALLQQAARTGGRVWLGYVNAQGLPSERVVDPVSVEGGYLTAYDERSDSTRTFALHRVTAVAAVEEGVGADVPQDEPA